VGRGHRSRSRRRSASAPASPHGVLMKSQTYQLQLSCLASMPLPNRTAAPMELYIRPLYVLVSKILSSILDSPAPIHPLYLPLSTLSTVGPTCHFI
jgi:hypothetical protein